MHCPAKIRLMSSKKVFLPQLYLELCSLPFFVSFSSSSGAVNNTAKLIVCHIEIPSLFTLTATSACRLFAFVCYRVNQLSRLEMNKNEQGFCYFIHCHYRCESLWHLWSGHSLSVSLEYVSCLLEMLQREQISQTG